MSCPFADGCLHQSIARKTCGASIYLPQFLSRLSPTVWYDATGLWIVRGMCAWLLPNEAEFFSGQIMTKRKRVCLRLAGYLIIGVVAAIWIISLTSEDRISESSLKKIQTGMTQKEVERILGSPPIGIGKTNYWPVHEPAPRKSLVWRGALVEISVVFDDNGEVIAKWSSRASAQSFSEKVKRWLHLPWW